MRLVVLLERGGRRRQCAGRTERAQHQVDAKDKTVFGDGRKQALHVLCESHEVFVVADAARAVGIAGIAVTENQVDVGREIQLARWEEHTSELQSLMRIAYAVF